MKAIIFDFGNVIGFFDHALTLGRLAPFTDMSTAEMFRTVYTSDLEDHFESGRMTAPEFLQQARKLCRLTCDDAFMTGAVADIFQPNAEVCDLIPALKKNYRLILGSNTNEIHAAKFLDQFAEVLSHFDHHVLSYRIKARKPRAEFFNHCVEHAGCPAAECLFVDDLPANIAGAEAAGLHGLLYYPGGNLLGELQKRGVLCRVR